MRIMQRLPKSHSRFLLQLATQNRGVHVGLTLNAFKSLKRPISEGFGRQQSIDLTTNFRRGSRRD